MYFSGVLVWPAVLFAYPFQYISLNTIHSVPVGSPEVEFIDIVCVSLDVSANLRLSFDLISVGAWRVMGDEMKNSLKMVLEHRKATQL